MCVIKRKGVGNGANTVKVSGSQTLKKKREKEEKEKTGLNDWNRKTTGINLNRLAAIESDSSLWCSR